MKRRNVIKSLLASLGIMSASAMATPVAPVTSSDEQARVNGLDELIDIQTREAAYDHDPYMTGLANGLILARSAIFGGDVKFMQPKLRVYAPLPPNEQVVKQLALAFPEAPLYQRQLVARRIVNALQSEA
jgi:hypothetical protein